MWQSDIFSQSAKYLLAPRAGAARRDVRNLLNRRRTRFSRGVSLYAFAAAIFAVSSVCAQTAIPPVITRVVPDIAPDLTTGTIISSADGKNWFVTGGRYTGPADNVHQNLFDSFQYFDIKAGDAVVWLSDSNAASVKNVINRITGGEPSQLYGSMIATAFPNADFYFLNPAGIIIGNGFHISVSQGLYISTAATLRFKNNDTLIVRPGNGSSLSQAAPESFGFLNSSADILLDDGPLTASVTTGDGSIAALSAANVTMSGAKLTTGDSDFRLLAVGSTAFALTVDPRASVPVLSGRVSMTGSAENLIGCLCDPASPPRIGGFGLYGGTITVSNSTVDSASTAGGQSGSIRIVGDAISIGRSAFTSSTGNSFDGGAITVSGNTVTLTRARMSTATSGAGNAGDIKLAALSGAFIDTDSDLSSVATDFVNSGISPLVTGATGNIAISASGDLHLTGSTIGLQAEDYAARVGGVDIAAGGDVVIRPDGGMPGTGVRIFDSTNAVASFVATPAGKPESGIRISGNRVDITGNSLRTNRVDGYPDRVQIGSTTTTDQRSGGVTISARGNLNVTRSDILATAQGPLSAIGSGGGLTLNGANIALDNTLMESSSLNAGDAGGATLAATDALTLTNFSVLSSASSGRGKAGNVTVSFGTSARLDNGSRIDSDVSGMGTRAGDLIISAPKGSLAVASSGPGTAAERTTTLSTNTANANRGGSITINVDALTLTGGAAILSQATGSATGSGGSVNVTARAITLQGFGSAIAANSDSSSAAGSINLSANRIALLDGAALTTSSRSGPAGAINLALPDNGILQMTGRVSPVFITTDSGAASGGVITISKPLAIITDGGVITALGQIRSASVDISGAYFIRSADRANILSVDGNLVIDSQITDVSRGINVIKAEFVDARQVLSGRCASTKVSGVTSQLAEAAPGPYSGSSETSCLRDSRTVTAPLHH